MTYTHIETLQGLRLPEEGRLRRDHVRPEGDRSALYLDRYDDRTVAYDCVRRADGKGLLLSGPPLYNLWRPLKAGLHADGRPLGRKLRRWSHGQADLVYLGRNAQKLTLTLEGVTHAIPIRDSIAPQFAGRNTLVLLNKDNQLDWIERWLDYYIRAHRADAILVFDNGSQTYDTDALLKTLTACGRLQTAAIFEAPFSFGPPIKSKGRQVNPRFLQTVLLNLARVDILSQARAVLNVDVDEIIQTDGSRSVFDMAVERPQSMVKMHGSWVFPPPDASLPAPHGEHTHRAVPNMRCNQKWCAVPSGLLSRFGWGVHHVGGTFVKVIDASTEARLLHCRGTSTAWKAKRFDLPKTRQEDPDLSAFMTDWFTQ